MKKMHDSLVFERGTDSPKHIFFSEHSDSASENFIFRGYYIHKSIEILFLYDGKMECSIGKLKGIIEKNGVCIFNSFDRHSFKYIGNASFFCLCISFDFFDDILPKGAEFINFPEIDADTFEKIITFLRMCKNDIKTFNNIQKSGMVNYIFGHLMKNNIFRQKSERKNDIVVDICEYIEENFTEPITLSSVAEKFSYSKNYISALFNRVVGQSIPDYINRLRLEEVDSLLKSNDKKNKTLNEIIFKAGFGCRETYYRTLKKTGGKYPPL